MRQHFRLFTLVALTIAPCLASGTSPAAASSGAVVTPHRLESQAGAEILAAGGNAFDAAVAAGYAEAVVNPCCGSVGGGGVALSRAPYITRTAGGKGTVPR